MRPQPVWDAAALEQPAAPKSASRLAAEAAFAEPAPSTEPHSQPQVTVRKSRLATLAAASAAAGSTSEPLPHSLPHPLPYSLPHSLQGAVPGALAGKRSEEWAAGAGQVVGATALAAADNKGPRVFRLEAARAPSPAVEPLPVEVAQPTRRADADKRPGPVRLVVQAPAAPQRNAAAANQAAAALVVGEASTRATPSSARAPSSSATVRTLGLPEVPLNEVFSDLASVTSILDAAQRAQSFEIFDPRLARQWQQLERAAEGIRKAIKPKRR